MVWACLTTPDEAAAVQWALDSSYTDAIYVGTVSMQRKAKERTSSGGQTYFTPVRSQANAVALKSLFIDVDVKDGRRIPHD